MSEDKTALVIDDHPVTHLGCRRLLAEAGYHAVFEARDSLTAYAELDRHSPELVVLDLGLPGTGGLDMIGPLLQRAPKARILIFSMKASPAFAKRALEAGAHGYLAKNSPPEAFLQAVHRLERGLVYLEADFAVDVAVHDTRREAGPLSQLNAREREILSLLGQGLNYGEIAERSNISYKTVANACVAMKRKLSARNLPDLIRVAMAAEKSEQAE